MPKKIFGQIAFLHFGKDWPYRIFLNFAYLFCKKNNTQRIIGGHRAYFLLMQQNTPFLSKFHTQVLP